MNDQADNLPMNMNVLRVPTPTEARQAVSEARQLFARVLSAWASDALVMRRAGRNAVRWQTNRRRATGWSKAA